MSVQENFKSSHTEKIKKALKANRTVYRVTFSPSEANPGETLNAYVPKLGENEVIVPNSMALLFDIDLTGAHANNFLVQNVSRALVSKLVVKFANTVLQDLHEYDVYKIFQDLFLPEEKRKNMYLEGVQSEDLCKIRSDAGDKKTSGVDKENKLNQIYSKKYKINLDNEILTDHGVFYPQALYHELLFQLTLAPASQVVKGVDATKLKYKLTNIQLQYEIISDNSKERETIGENVKSEYTSGKEFLYDHVVFDKMFSFKRAETNISVKVNAQRRSMKGLLLLFVEPYKAGARDSEKYIFPDINKIKVTINGKPSMLYNEGIEKWDIWEEVSRFFIKEKEKPQYMDIDKFYTDNKFGLLIDLRSMPSQKMHGSGTRLVNSSDGVYLKIERTASGSGDVNCHVYIISDAQFNLINRQLDSLQY